MWVGVAITCMPQRLLTSIGTLIYLNDDLTRSKHCTFINSQNVILLDTFCVEGQDWGWGEVKCF